MGDFHLCDHKSGRAVLVCLQAGAVDSQSRGKRAASGATIRRRFKAQDAVLAGLAIAVLDSNDGIYVVSPGELPPGKASFDVSELPAACRATNPAAVVMALARRLTAPDAPWAGDAVRAACEAAGVQYPHLPGGGTTAINGAITTQICRVLAPAATLLGWTPSVLTEEGRRLGVKFEWAREGGPPGMPLSTLRALAALRGPGFGQEFLGPLDFEAAADLIEAGAKHGGSGGGGGASGATAAATAGAAAARTPAAELAALLRSVVAGGDAPVPLELLVVAAEAVCARLFIALLQAAHSQAEACDEQVYSKQMRLLRSGEKTAAAALAAALVTAAQPGGAATLRDQLLGKTTMQRLRSGRVRSGPTCRILQVGVAVRLGRQRDGRPAQRPQQRRSGGRADGEDGVHNCRPPQPAVLAAANGRGGALGRLWHQAAPQDDGRPGCQDAVLGGRPLRRRRHVRPASGGQQERCGGGGGSRGDGWEWWRRRRRRRGNRSGCITAGHHLTANSYRVEHSPVLDGLSGQHMRRYIWCKEQ
jgi:hypothetical protein